MHSDTNTVTDIMPRLLHQLDNLFTRHQQFVDDLLHKIHQQEKKKQKTPHFCTQHNIEQRRIDEMGVIRLLFGFPFISFDFRLKVARVVGFGSF